MSVENNIGAIQPDQQVAVEQQLPSSPVEDEDNTPITQQEVEALEAESEAADKTAQEAEQALKEASGEIDESNEEVTSEQVQQLEEDAASAEKLAVDAEGQLGRALGEQVVADAAIELKKPTTIPERGPDTKRPQTLPPVVPGPRPTIPEQRTGTQNKPSSLPERGPDTIRTTTPTSEQADKKSSPAEQQKPSSPEAGQNEVMKELIATLKALEKQVQQQTEALKTPVKPAADVVQRAPMDANMEKIWGKFYGVMHPQEDRLFGREYTTKKLAELLESIKLAPSVALQMLLSLAT